MRAHDPDGRAAETVWDVFNIALGIASFGSNVSAGNYGSAALDAVGVVVDAVATAVPFVPGGVGAFRKGGNLVDAAKASEEVAPGGAISMDDALGQAASFMKDGVPVRSFETNSGIQFVQEFTENGKRITRRAGIDVNPNSGHVQQSGPHLNLQTQVNGRAQRSGNLADPHTPIDSRTVRDDDY